MAASHRAAATLLAVTSLLVAVALSVADARPAVRPDKTVAASISGAGTSSLTVRRDEHGPGYVAVAGDAGTAAVANPECDDEGGDDDEEEEPDHHSHHDHPDHPSHPDHPGHGGSGNPVEQDPEHDGCEHMGDHGGSDESAVLSYPQSGDQVGQDPERAGDETDYGWSDDSAYPPSSGGTESELGQELCSDCEEPKKPKPEQPCNTCEPEPKQLTCNKAHTVQEGETCDSVGQCAGLGHDDLLRFNPNLCCDNLFVGQWICLDATCAD